MQSGFADSGSWNPVRGAGIAGKGVHTDGRVGKKFSDESRKRPRSLRLPPALRAEWKRAQKDPEWISAPGSTNFGSPSVAPGELPAGRVPCFFTEDSLTCARTLTKGFRGVNDGAPVSFGPPMGGEKVFWISIQGHRMEWKS